MPLVKFLETVTVKDAEGATFEKDEVYELSEDSAEHWIRRKKARVVDDPKAKATAEPKKSGPPQTKAVGEDGSIKPLSYDVPPPRGEKSASLTAADVRKLKRAEVDELAAKHKIDLKDLNVPDSQEFLVSELKLKD